VRTKPLFSYDSIDLNLGVLYENGEGVGLDLGEAARWYRQVAAGGEVLAQLTLGLMYREGRGVPRDDRKAARWFCALADRGFAIGQINLAFMYLDGLGVERNDAAAAALLMKAAARGHPVAQNNLALTGRGVPADAKLAAKWHAKAARQGLADAQHRLGLLYERGQGVERDDAEAARWYRLNGGGIHHMVRHPWGL
jgi:uncharacterized protein